MSGSAPGGSISVFGRAISSMPFSIVPVLSKSEVIERSTQPDIWFSRMRQRVRRGDARRA